MIVSGTLAAALTGSVLAAEPAPASPLDRLRQRSATDRWDELRSQYAPTGVLPIPDAAPEPVGTRILESNQPVTRVSPAGAQPPAGEDDFAPPASEPQRTQVFSAPSPTLVRPVPSPFGDVAPGADAFLAAPGMGEGLSTPVRPEYLGPPVVQEAHVQRGIVPPQPLQPVPDEQDAQSLDTIFRPITRIEPHYDYSPTGKQPYEYLCPQPSSVPEDQRLSCPNIEPLPATGQLERYCAHVHYHWVASNLYHKPLYFEDVPLERYGHTFPEIVQPFVSLGKFGVQLIGLPYQMALDPVWRDQYALGYYRPGDPAPELFYQVPINFKAAAAAAGVYTGLFYLIP